MDVVWDIDAHLRFVNPEFDAVIRGEKDLADPIILPLKPVLAELETRIEALLRALL
jgi:hypothetical protein